jgi:tetratricopeptide (TPR) repeat protein
LDQQARQHALDWGQKMRVRCAAAAALLLALLLAGCSPPGARDLRTGEQLLRDGHPAEAMAPLKEAIILLATNAPACAQAWNHLGLAYHYSGRPTQADAAYQRALAKDFNLFAARYNRGCLLLEQNILPGAISELTSFTAHRPEKAEGWIKLGTAQLRARQYDAAERSFQQVVKLNPRPAMLAEALNGLGVSQAWQRRPREAFQSLDAALRQQTNCVPAFLNQAIIAQQSLKDRPLALQKYKTYLSLAPPGPNQSAVAAIVKQLESDLRPVSPLGAPAATAPPPHLLAATQLVRQPTVAAKAPGPTPPLPAPPAPVQTSAPPKPGSLTGLASTSPPPLQVVQTPSRPEPSQGQIESQKPKIKTQPELPLEVVKLPTEPEIKPAQEVRIPAPELSSPAPAAPPTAVPPQVQATPPVTAKPAAGPPLVRTLSKPKPAKKSLLQTINPVNWVGAINPLNLFGGKRGPAPKGQAPPAPPEPAPAKPPALSPPVTLAVSAAPAPPPPRPRPPAFARYQYQPVVKPAAGNRGEAARLFAEGVEVHKNGRASEALAAYQKAVAADPSFFDARYNLGAVAYEIADWPRALSAYEQALIIEPADVNARYNFALSLQKANYPLDAVNELEAIVATHPDETTAHLALANLQAYSLAQPAKAREHYLKVLQLQPNHPQANLIRAWLLANP